MDSHVLCRFILGLNNFLKISIAIFLNNIVIIKPKLALMIYINRLVSCVIKHLSTPTQVSNIIFIDIS